jgi:proline dehydrogenase
MERSLITRRLVNRFVAGENLASALEAAERLARCGILSTLDHLGENVTSADAADECLRDGLAAIAALSGIDQKATLSIKLTQFGLDQSVERCTARVLALAAAAKAAGTGIEIDMESSHYTSATLELVRRVHTAHGNARAVIQAYLYRSEEDVKALCREAIPVRLCKGAYLEPAGTAFPKKKDVDRNYLKLLRILLEEGKQPALATHDAALVSAARRLARSLGLGEDAFEFQMLYGVRRRLQRKLARDGFRVRVYVPYGQAWFPYFMRRIAERPANLLFLLRQVVRL